MTDTCKQRGKVRPDKCACAGGWPYADLITPICDNYQPSNADCWCARCEHDHACHAGKG